MNLLKSLKPIHYFAFAVGGIVCALLAGIIIFLDQVFLIIPPPSTCQYCFHETQRMLFPQSPKMALPLDKDNVLLLGGGVADSEGGADEKRIFRAAQIYNVSEDRFYSTGLMNYPRHEDFTATLLNDGRVLIVGGENGREHKIYGEVEVFDPKSRKFRVLPTLSIPRAGHNATLLKDGRVLITGGYAPDYYPPYNHKRFNNALIFDPIKNTISAPIPMTVPPTGHASILLTDGRVLVCGGGDPYGGNTAEYFDVKKNEFVQLPAMHVDRRYHQLILLQNGNVMTTNSGNDRNWNEIFDSKNNHFFKFFPNPFLGVDPLTVNQDLVLFSSACEFRRGYFGGGRCNYAELVNLKTKNAQLIGPTPDWLVGYVSFISHGRVYFMGGVRTHRKRTTNKVEVSDAVDTGYYIKLEDLEKIGK